MSDIDFLDPHELRVMRMFSRAATSVLGRIDADLDGEHDLPRVYFDLLWRLRRAPERSLRLAELAQQTASKPSRITHAVGVLEKRGLVERRAVEGDRRGAAAVLTPAGLALAEQAAPTYADGARRHFLDLLDADERRSLARILETVLESVDPDAVPEPAGDEA
ncbi:MarR family winged helix-turn-helix transcriptional regulator [Nocardioides hwasunensis]|uniref:MarR family transcriptional regulator n=1 Tax=Nocardioides hwasunensis TaxID=397258 RepID=A0ABR8MPY1_9ACTN|nr:MarR family transcriptional regulator [Nocardioides hwasunensis]MBD3916927.1 MarR family transcriptional regulator [Nocardioides hwasunensis]